MGLIPTDPPAFFLFLFAISLLIILLIKVIAIIIELLFNGYDFTSFSTSSRKRFLRRSILSRTRTRSRQQDHDKETQTMLQASQVNRAETTDFPNQEDGEVIAFEDLISNTTTSSSTPVTTVTTRTTGSGDSGRGSINMMVMTRLMNQERTKSCYEVENLKDDSCHDPLLPQVVVTTPNTPPSRFRVSSTVTENDTVSATNSKHRRPKYYLSNRRKYVVRPTNVNRKPMRRNIALK